MQFLSRLLQFSPSNSARFASATTGNKSDQAQTRQNHGIRLRFWNSQGSGNSQGSAILKENVADTCGHVKARRQRAQHKRHLILYQRVIVQPTIACSGVVSSRRDAELTAGYGSGTLQIRAIEVCAAEQPQAGAGYPLMRPQWCTHQATRVRPLAANVAGYRRCARVRGCAVKHCARCAGNQGGNGRQARVSEQVEKDRGQNICRVLVHPQRSCWLRQPADCRRWYQTGLMPRASRWLT